MIYGRVPVNIQRCFCYRRRRFFLSCSFSLFLIKRAHCSSMWNYNTVLCQPKIDSALKLHFSSLACLLGIVSQRTLKTRSEFLFLCVFALLKYSDMLESFSKYTNLSFWFHCEGTKIRIRGSEESFVHRAKATHAFILLELVKNAAKQTKMKNKNIVLGFLCRKRMQMVKHSDWLIDHLTRWKWFGYVARANWSNVLM